MFSLRLLIKTFKNKSINNNFLKYSSKTSFKMAGDCGVPLKNIIEKLESFASTSTAESWDNVGLLVDPISDKDIKNILLTNDLTEDIIIEAKEKNAGLIVSYHPPVFKPMNRITSNAWKERLVINCIKNDIAVYSPHTSWDIVNGGVNDWLSKAFDVMSTKVITETGCGRLLDLAKPIELNEAIHRVKRHIGIPHIQLGLARGKTKESLVSSVALCAGSGASVLGGVKADLYLTGEMSHHEVLDACQKGINVILCHHSNTERGFLSQFAPDLQNQLDGKVNVYVSKVDHDPLTIV